MEKNEACESWERKELKIPGIDWSQIMQVIKEQIWTKQTHMSEKSKQKERKKKVEWKESANLVAVAENEGERIWMQLWGNHSARRKTHVLS